MMWNTKYGHAFDSRDIGRHPVHGVSPTRQIRASSTHDAVHLCAVSRRKDHVLSRTDRVTQSKSELREEEKIADGKEVNGP
jgi:hypothetical protein